MGWRRKGWLRKLSPLVMRNKQAETTYTQQTAPQPTKERAIAQHMPVQSYIGGNGLPTKRSVEAQHTHRANALQPASRLQHSTLTCFPPKKKKILNALVAPYAMPGFLPPPRCAVMSALLSSGTAPCLLCLPSHHPPPLVSSATGYMQPFSTPPTATAPSPIPCFRAHAPPTTSNVLS